MSRFAPQPAVKKALKARVALAGPAGSGKTYTALELAHSLGQRIVVIDTERRSAELYADRWQFDTVPWAPPFDPRELAQAIKDAGSGDVYDVLIIDSLSHFWSGEGGTLQIVDNAAERARGNKFAGWKTGTPAQDSMVDAMLQSPIHVIATMRSKTEYVQEQVNGRTEIRRVGLAPVQRDQLDYEFTVTADLNIEHTLTVDKTRCSVLSGRSYPMGRSSEMAATLAAWLDDGAAAVPEPEPASPHTEVAVLNSGDTPPANGADDPAPRRPSSAMNKKLFALLRDHHVAEADRHSFVAERLGRPLESFTDLTHDDVRSLIDQIDTAPAAGDAA
jgi:DNA polymerase III delta prime subunit